ncbi:MAG: PTS transporter subunit EIIC [Elusimicrobiaceae bacterium]|nr:PTS transporter subunit EIIC [Elusimicrobiaceae bacterium]
MPANLKNMYEQILEVIGGVDNIIALGSCITRLRIIVKDNQKVNVESLRQIRDVAGYFYSGEQHQLIVGPSTASRLADYFNERHHFPSLEGAVRREPKAPSKISSQLVSDTKKAVRQKYSSKISQVCGRIGHIFLPLIPAYIGCGLIIGIGNILAKTCLADYPNVVALINVMGQSVFVYLMAIVGYNANKEFGGSPALGLAFAGILNAPALDKIALFGLTLSPGKGGVLAVLAVCWVGSWVERKLRNCFKGSMELFLTPMLTILLVGATSLAVIQPVAGWAADGLASLTQWLLQNGGAVVGAFLGGTFLPLVMLGIHQSLIPIHQQLLDSLGSNPLFPILCMAGAGQVGAGLAVLLETQDPRFKTIVKNALPVGLLGIGEPLIYGVTLPLFKPFIAACIGGAAGGAVVALCHVSSSIPFGVSGVILLFALSNLHSMIFYALGYIVAVAVGFFSTWWLGFDEPDLQA